MNTYLQMSGLVYVLLVGILYFGKRNINTLENKIFGGMIIHTIIVLIVDIISRVYVVYYPITKFSIYLFKFNIFFFAAYFIIFSFYIFVLTSKKNPGLVPYNENPNREYFKKRTLLMVIFLILTMIAILPLPLELSVVGGRLNQSGLSMTISYITGACCVIAWVIMLLGNKDKTKRKKYAPVYIFILIALIAVILQVLIPYVCFISTVIAYLTVITYYTIENPDVNLISKLNVARKEAEAANKSKTDFLSSMSHEIRTPLNAIVGFGQALAKEDISGTAKEEVHDIIMASNTLLDIVNGILDISKIESNKIEIINGEYSTKKMINEITSLINARIGSKPIDFKILVDENLPAVLYGDEMRVKQVIINLLTNAVKYTNEGRILFQVKTKNEKDICKMTIEVADTGIGMTEESLQQLFTKFQRFDITKNMNIEGTGLGMAITKGLIDLMGGEIKVKSKYEEGSTFTVTINQKIVQQKLDYVEEAEKIGQIKAFNASGSRILVVDDNKINLKVAERLLKDYSITVETVNSGAECLDKVLEGQKYDLIFMDIMMPKMNGVEALRNLKNIVGFKMPVVALTADVISGMEEKYISQGFDDCLAKPIIEDELYYMLRKFLKEIPSTETGATTQQETAFEYITPPTNESHSRELLENNRIDVSAGLELLKDMEMYEMTLEEFYNELLNKLNELKEYKESGNMDDYAILAHALKTEARYVGCTELGDMAYEHELAGKAQNQEQVNEKFATLSEEVNRIHDVLTRYFN